MDEKTEVMTAFLGGDELWGVLGQLKSTRTCSIHRVTGEDPVVSSEFDALLIEVGHLPEREFGELVSRHDSRSLPVIALLRALHSDDATFALSAGASDVVQLPISGDVLRARLRWAVRSYRREHRLTKLTAARFRLLQEALPLMMYEGSLANGSHARLEGFQLWAGEPDQEIAPPQTFEEWRACIHPDDQHRYWAALQAVRTQELSSWAVEYRWSHDQENWQWMLDRGARTSDAGPEVIGFVLDISERRSLELQLSHAQKMEAIGRLAGGVAHDFNNLLTAIINFTWYVRDELPAESSLRDDLGEVLKAAESGANLTSQLLAFSRRRPVETEVVELNDRLQKMHHVLQRTLGERIEVVVSPADQSLRVAIDPVQFDQMLFNLAVNARDAMPSGGTLYIQLNHQDEDTAIIQVVDTGMGIPADVIDQVFDPFFSTKGESGTGLGLAASYGIVRQAGGDISVRSEPGEGTRFTITLPLEITQGFTGTHQQAALPDVARGMVALVVEDQPAILTMIRRTMVRAGYQVEAAPTAEEALQIADSLDQPPAILVSDVILPGMSGTKLARKLRKHWPELRIVLTSGYLGDEQEDLLEQGENSTFLPKPFTPTQLVASVARLTGRAQEAEHTETE